MRPVELPVPEISVIVPIHDVGHYAGPCIASLRAQTWRDFEAIVIDDGSTDGSGDRARAAAADDPRFCFVTQSNQGLSAARNVGLARARGKFVAFLDGDDRFSSGFLERMRAALLTDGGDWVACAVMNCHPDGHESALSAIHGTELAGLQAEPQAAGQPRRWPMANWPEILRHFPSAWNKLYRRTFIGDLRFDEGTWFEDHAFFQQLACRTAYLLHLPEPLYLQTRGRVGQITETDSERIFEQFLVLERLHSIMAASDRPGADVGFAELTCRLIHERMLALRDPVRKSRFLTQAGDFLRNHDLRYSADEFVGVSPSLGMVLDGKVPLTVVIVPYDAVSGSQSLSALGTSLRSLAMQDISRVEVLVACPPDFWPPDGLKGVVEGQSNVRLLSVPAPGPAAWKAGVQAARGRFVVLAAPGDGFEPIALRHWCDAALRHRVKLVFSAYRAPADGGYRDGWGNRTGLPPELVDRRLDLGPPISQRLHPMLCAKLFELGLLSECLTDDPDPVAAGNLADVALVLAAEARVGGAVWIDFPGALPALRRRGPEPRAMLRDMKAFSRLPVAASLTDGWQRQIFARWARERVDTGFSTNHAFGRLAAFWFLVRAGLGARLSGLSRQTGPLDASITPRLRRIMGLTPPS